jgi:hypothetical protein
LSNARDETDESRRRAYRAGFNEGYRKGYKKGLDEGLERSKRQKKRLPVRFLKIQCECGVLNFHPIFENKLVINEDEERRCFNCGKIMSRDDILEHYSKLQSN